MNEWMNECVSLSVNTLTAPKKKKKKKVSRHLTAASPARLFPPAASTEGEPRPPTPSGRTRWSVGLDRAVPSTQAAARLTSLQPSGSRTTRPHQQEASLHPVHQLVSLPERPGRWTSQERRSSAAACRSPRDCRRGSSWLCCCSSHLHR